MTPPHLRDRALDLAWLTALASECLGLSEEEIDPAVPLVRHGLDSVAAVQLVAAVADKLGRDVPPWLLLDYPDLNSLARYLATARSAEPSVVADTKEPATTDDLMLADSVLPDDIRPPRASRMLREPRYVLLTGATGFLGAFVLRTLLRDTPARVYCLVRPEEDMTGRDRIRKNLELYGIWQQSFAPRVCAVGGDLVRPQLGLSSRRFEALGRRVDAIYHCAAAVNWVLAYEDLRGTNVRGTVELLRLACRHRAKPFHFVSTLAVCYATDGPAEVRERDDMFAHRAALPLGYAQSKCVAETLIRAAAARGLPATIHRPALLCGDAGSGISSTEDFLSTVIKGCVHMQAAPDLDWRLDACPVDFAADALVGLARRRRGLLHVTHLKNPATRHWRELVLWMNLFGYPIRLVSYPGWLARLEAEATTSAHPLYRLRAFFLARPAGSAGLTLPELYEEDRRSRARDGRTRRALEQLPTQCPELGTQLLNRYFRSFIERGFLPPVAETTGAAGRCDGQRLDEDFFRGILRRHYGDATLQVREAATLPGPSGDSILTELTSWRYGTPAGLSRHRLILESGSAAVPRSLDVFVKVKAQDRQVMEVADRVAALCGTELGVAFARFKDRTGLAGCHVRELDVYAQEDDRFRRHVPVVFGTVRDDAGGRWALVLESLSGMALFNGSGKARGWRRPHVEAAVRGIAEVHALWFGREAELLAQPWLEPTVSARGMAEMKDLWTCLADYAARFFTSWIGHDLRPLQRDLIASVEQWWQPLEAMPRTLTHNDFNPRNLAMRRTSGGLRLCAYDWELATLGVPQHDLAELLCFVLPPGFAEAEVLAYLEAHRLALERATGCGINAACWRLGFELSLKDLIVNRLPMYCLVHTFRRQPFLERVVRTWMALYKVFCSAHVSR